MCVRVNTFIRGDLSENLVRTSASSFGSTAVGIMAKKNRDDEDYRPASYQQETLEFPCRRSTRQAGRSQRLHTISSPHQRQSTSGRRGFRMSAADCFERDFQASSQSLSAEVSVIDSPLSSSASSESVGFRTASSLSSDLNDSASSPSPSRLQSPGNSPEFVGFSPLSSTRMERIEVVKRTLHTHQMDIEYDIELKKMDTFCLKAMIKIGIPFRISKVRE